jgi:hypothetical protein
MATASVRVGYANVYPAGALKVSVAAQATGAGGAVGFPPGAAAATSVIGRGLAFPVGAYTWGTPVAAAGVGSATGTGTFTGGGGTLKQQRIAAIAAMPFPRRAVFYYGAQVNSLNNVANQQAVARFDLAVLGLYPRWSNGGYTPQSIAAAIKGYNPGMILGCYSIMDEIPTSGATGAWSVIYAYVTAQNWWANLASGAKVAAWYAGSYMVQTMDNGAGTYPVPDAQARRYQQYYADTLYAGSFAGGTDRSHYDLVFLDNQNYDLRSVMGNWLATGTDISGSNATVASKWRTSLAQHWDRWRSMDADLLLLGNCDSDMSYSEFANASGSGPLDMATLENPFQYLGSWNSVMSRYFALANYSSSTKLVTFGSNAATPTNGTGGAWRYQLCSCLMGNGFIQFAPGGDYSTTVWLDEYDNPLGAATQLAATSTSSVYSTSGQGSAGSWKQGVWRRDFVNGIALVNPSGSSQTVALDGTFRKISGTQDPSVNNGATGLTSVTIPNADGLVLLR